ncbi:MAG: hypothetical protein QM692_18630, partial [Thermomicrobiales bacterium]
GKRGRFVEPSTCDGLPRSGRARLHRRGLGIVAAASALAALVAGDSPAEDVAAKRRRRTRQAGAEHNVRGKKAIMCVDGETKRVPKARRKRYLKQGATRGACQSPPNPVCTPTCPAGSCNIADGCGGVCPGCAAGSLCAEGICQTCTVTCDAGRDAPTTCGERLQMALEAGGDVYVCPGEYMGTFLLFQDVRVYGAGNGANPATDAILTGLDVAQIMTLEAPRTVTLANLRFAHGVSSGGYGGALYIDDVAANVTVADCVFADGDSDYGAGIYAYQGTLHISGSQFMENHAVYDGGALFVYYATVTLNDTELSFNDADGDGGAMYVNDSGSSTTLTGCTINKNTAGNYGGGIASNGGPITISETTITGNTADEYGGGIYNTGGIVTLAASVSIISENTAGNPMPSGGGVYVQSGTFNRNGATISGNTPDQCVGTGCV